MKNVRIRAAAEGMPSIDHDALSNLIYEARMAARVADHLTTDILDGQEVTAAGPRVDIPAHAADLVMHSVNRVLICVESLENQFEAMITARVAGAKS